MGTRRSWAHFQPVTQPGGAHWCPSHPSVHRISSTSSPRTPLYSKWISSVWQNFENDYVYLFPPAWSVAGFQLDCRDLDMSVPRKAQGIVHHVTGESVRTRLSKVLWWHS